MTSRPSVISGGAAGATESGHIRRGRMAYDASLATFGDLSTEPPASWTSRPLWDPASGRFDPVRLRAAILARGWTVAEFACFYGGGRGTFYRLMQGFAPGDRTVIHVNEPLASREPTLLIDG